MMLKKEFYDKDFGRLLIKVNSRARNIVLYIRTDGVHITIPPNASEEEVLNALEKFRGKLLKDKKKVDQKRIDFTYHIDSEFFKLKFIKGSLDKFFVRYEMGVMEIIYPPEINFQKDEIQIWLRKVVEEGLRKRARSILPGRLEHLSGKLNLPYAAVKINSSKGRWGSCSARKNINLSFYLILLPSHLIDYVLIHELCHTKEMNHGEKFWALLDLHTQNKAQQLRAELRTYRTELI